MIWIEKTKGIMKKHFIRSVNILCACFLLASCASMQPSAPPVKQAWERRQIETSKIESFQINGKIAILTARQSGSATVNWLQNRQRYNIELYGPLGMNALKLAGQPGLVTLKTADGKTVSAHTPEELLIQQWRWHLPVSNLKYWIRALPVPNIPSQKQFDAYQRLSQMQQDHWYIQYSNYTRISGVDLPTHISINSPDFKTKIVIYSWKIS